VREIPKHTNASGISIHLTIQLGQNLRALGLSLHDLPNARVVAFDLMFQHLPCDAEEPLFSNTLECGIQLDDHKISSTLLKTAGVAA
jgi:hypothetical protein